MFITNIFRVTGANVRAHRVEGKSGRYYRVDITLKLDGSDVYELTIFPEGNLTQQKQIADKLTGKK